MTKKNDIFHNSQIFWNTAQAFIHHYLPDIRKASVNTTASYRDSLNSYIDFLNCNKGIGRAHISFSHFDEKTLKEYQNYLLNEKKLAPRTCNLRLTALRSFLEYSADEYKDLIAIYVSARHIKDSQTTANPIEFFEKRQMKAILAAPDIRTKTGRRNQMMLILLYDTGSRAAELLEMSVGSLHLNADVPYVTIHGKGDKYRNVPLMEKTCMHIKRYISEFHPSANKEDPLFYAVTHGWKHPLSEDTLSNLIKDCSSKAAEKGIEMPASCHCHMIRKTRAMDLYQAGVPLAHIQQLLGHSNISTTSGFYAFATLETLSKSMQKAEIGDNSVDKKWKDKTTLKKLYSL